MVGTAEGCTASVASMEDARQIIQTAVDEFGEQRLANNAGIPGWPLSCREVGRLEQLLEHFRTAVGTPLQPYGSLTPDGRKIL